MVMYNKYGATEIFTFFKEFKVTKADNRYINTITDSEFVSCLEVKN